jgi:hypothetical protein
MAAVDSLAGHSDAFDLVARHVLVFYETDRIWHERFIVAAVPPSAGDPRTSGWFVVATPDGDIYAESLAAPNVRGLYLLAANRAAPVGLQVGSIHWFENGSTGYAPRAVDLPGLLLAGQSELDRITAEFASLPGAGAAGAVVAAAVVAPMAGSPHVPLAGVLLAPPLGHSWVVASKVGLREVGGLVGAGNIADGHRLGNKAVLSLFDGSIVLAELVHDSDLVNFIDRHRPVAPAAPAVYPPAPSPAVRPGVLAPVGVASGDDARTLAVRYGNDGKRRRELRDGVEISTESAWADWPIRGPRTARWVCQYISSNGGSALIMHNTWKQICKLQNSDNGVTEHESLCKMLELALEYDQLNIGELALLEMVCRRLQMVQYRWRDRIIGSTSTGTIDDEMHYFLGTDPTRGNLCIAPSLNVWLGEELHKEQLANKEQRKAREERALLRGPKKGDK